MIRTFLGRAASWLVAGLFGVGALVLIAIDIFDFKLSDIQETVEKPVPGEVKQYVLFTTVPFKRWKVTTGIRYVSTAKRVVESQWCYIDQPGGADGPGLQLTLSSTNILGMQIQGSHSSAALRPFGLTANTARSLVKSHCRFQADISQG